MRSGRASFSPDLLMLMASPFKIPKKKQPSGSASIHMQSPLSRLQSSTSDQKSSYGAQSSRGGADRMHAGNTLGSPTNRQSGPYRPIFKDVVKNLLGLNSPNGGASAANHRPTRGFFSQSAPGQRAESSSPCFSNGASERSSPPQKKKSDLSGVCLPTKRISVESMDSLAELRGVKHSGSSSWRWDAAEWKRDIGSPSSSVNQQRTILSLSGSDQTSEDESVCLTGIRANPSADKSPKRRPSLFPAAISPQSSRATADTRRSLNRTERPSSSGSRREDPREEERRRWMKFREKKKTNRSAVLGLQLKKTKPTPTELIVLSSEEEEEGEDEGDRGKRRLQSSGWLEESCLGDSRKMQAQQARSSKGGRDECKPSPPSFLQLEFTSLHAGLMRLDANGQLMITDHAITIPVKVPAGSEEGDVTVVASQVKGYGVWDGGVAQDGTLLADCKGPAPSLLFLWVSDAQANLLQMELAALQTPPTSSGPACCCLLLVLKEQLQELPAALLASVLDMEEYRKGLSSRRPTSPLDWTDGLLLLHSCPAPLDQHLFRLLGCSAQKPRNGKSSQKSAALRQPPTRLIQYPLAPSKGRITVTKEDLACLDDGEFLNDVIIDFYLKYLFLEGVGGSVPEQSHVFSSFFYKQLSRRRAAADSDAPSVTDRHMRHQRVKTWTRHVDIFTKDFLFVPVNQESHWFLVVVCFPGLEDIQNVKLQSGSGASEKTAGKPSITLRSQQLPDCLQQTCRRDTVLKRPCILVMDSLKLSYHENVCRFLRDYLQVEWEVRRGTPRLFTSDSMRSSNCRVPRQDNSSDCGLYLLQYAESFLQNPVVHFDLPVHLENWFPQQRVRQKREEIGSLIMKMHRSQNEET